MLRKLLKYDMQSIWKIFLFLAGTVLLLSPLGGLAIRFMIQNESETLILLSVFSGFFLFINVMAIMAFSVIIAIMLYVRFYKNFFTDEGYLTFTLPVKRSTLLASKTINAVIWMLATLGVCILCVLEIILIAIPRELWETLPPNFWEMLQIRFSAWWLLYVPLVIFAILAVLWCSVSIFQFCITTGAVIAKRYKLLAAIGIYYLFNMVSSFVAQIFTIMGTIALEGVLSTTVPTLTDGEGKLLGAAIVLAVGAIAASLACLLHYLTLGHLERRLNLA